MFQDTAPALLTRVEESMAEHSFPVTLELRQTLPAEVDCGASLTLDVVVDTDSGADLAGAPFEIRDAEGDAVFAGQLPPLRQITPDSEDYDPRHGPVDQRPFARIAFDVPGTPGEQLLLLALPAFEVDGLKHEAAQLPLAFSTRRHQLYIVVWDVPSPVGAAAPFAVNVGVRCTAGCNLHGRTIEIRDAGGEVLATSTLGETPAAGTEGLYFVRVELSGPEAVGPHSWSVSMPKVPMRTTHNPPAPATLAFLAAPPGNHRVQVQLSDEQTGSPIASATVRMGPYRAHTDATGTVSLQVPRGDYAVRIMKNTYVAPDRPIVVDRDIELKLAISVPPEKDPYERYWKT